jgi:hypothetical protein
MKKDSAHAEARRRREEELVKEFDFKVAQKLGFG